MKLRSLYTQLALVYIFFLIVAIFYRGGGLDDNLEKILSIATFLFAIVIGFSIANRKQRLNSVRSKLRRDDALILTYYEESKMYGAEVTSKVRALIDNMLIKQIDYFLEDFDKSTPELIALIDYSVNLKVKNADPEGQKMMMSAGEDLMLNQKEIIYWVKDKMMTFEWISLLILGTIIEFCIYSLSDGSLLLLATLPLLATSIVLLLFVLRDINSLKLQEQDWIWDRLIELFTELGLPPYIPADLFEKQRVDKNKIHLPAEYRLVRYPSPYPCMDDKTVTLIRKES